VEGTSDGKQFSNTLQLEKTWLSAARLAQRNSKTIRIKKDIIKLNAPDIRLL